VVGLFQQLLDTFLLPVRGAEDVRIGMAFRTDAAALAHCRTSLPLKIVQPFRADWAANERPITATARKPC
jgi:hypothetical protein